MLSLSLSLKLKRLLPIFPEDILKKAFQAKDGGECMGNEETKEAEEEEEKLKARER